MGRSVHRAGAFGVNGRERGSSIIKSLSKTRQRFINSNPAVKRQIPLRFCPFCPASFQVVSPSAGQFVFKLGGIETQRKSPAKVYLFWREPPLTPAVKRPSRRFPINPALDGSPASSGLDRMIRQRHSLRRSCLSSRPHTAGRRK